MWWFVGNAQRQRLTGEWGSRDKIYKITEYRLQNPEMSKCSHIKRMMPIGASLLHQLDLIFSIHSQLALRFFFELLFEIKQFIHNFGQ